MNSSVIHPASFVAMLAGDMATAGHIYASDYRRLEQMGEHNYLATTAAFLAQAVTARDATARPSASSP